LHTTLTILSWLDKCCPLIGTTPSGQFYHDTKPSSIYRDFARPADAVRTGKNACQPWYGRQLIKPPGR